jgi:anaerobic magnesium-protoporphyrin IX monomethyl ester cyclase
MKLALVVTPWNSPLKKGYYYPSLGISYIGTYILKHLQDVDIIVIDGLLEDPVEVVKREKPDMIGISSTTLEFSNAIEIAQAIKSNIRAPIVIGGVHISALPNTLPKCFNVGVIGEGEQTMLELTQLYLQYNDLPVNELKKISGLVFYDSDGKIRLTKPKEFIKPLDEIPHPNLELFNIKYYLKPRHHLPGMFGKGVHIITSRGCPYKCVFCGGANFWQTVRLHSAEYVVEEIRNLIIKYDVECINILDDLFVTSKNRLIKIVKLIKEEKINERVKFGCQMRADLLDDEMAKLLKEMNVVYLGFGLESGSEKILTYLKKSTTTVESNT